MTANAEPGASASTGNGAVGSSISAAAAAIKASRTAKQTAAQSSQPSTPAKAQPKAPLTVQTVREQPAGDEPAPATTVDAPPADAPDDGDLGEQDAPAPDDFEDTDESLSVRALSTERLDEKFKVRSSGQVREVSLRDLIRDHAQVGESRKLAKEFSGRVSIVERAARHYVERLGALEQIIKEVSPKERTPQEWDQLFRTNQAEYFREKELAGSRKQQLEALKAERERAQQEEGRLADARVKEKALEEQGKLISRYPALQDPVKAKKFIEDVQGYLRTAHGATDDELAGINDSRFYVLAYKAMRYDSIRTSKQTVRKKIETVPEVPTLKPGAPVATQGAPGVAAVKRAKDAVQKSRGQDTDDVAALIAAKRQAGQRR